MELLSVPLTLSSRYILESKLIYPIVRLQKLTHHNFISLFKYEK